MEKVFVILASPPGPRETDGQFVETETEDGQGVYVPGGAYLPQPDGMEFWRIGPLFKLDDHEVELLTLAKRGTG